MTNNERQVRELVVTHPTLANKIFRYLVFLVGDTRYIKRFPKVTWDVHQHRIDLNEVFQDAVPLLEPGDIVLHRDEGFLSNIPIGGCMVHAGICVEDNQVVEAISDGVIKRHVAHLLYSDFACALRPRFNVLSEPKEEVLAKVLPWAEKIVGFPYDELFDFNYWEEMETIEKYGVEEAIKRGVRFCCTEVPSFCYLPYLFDLRFFRRRNVSAMTRMLSWIGLSTGESIIHADQYVTAETDIIWMSKEFTPEWAKKMGCSEEYVHKVSTWRKDKGENHGVTE